MTNSERILNLMLDDEPRTAHQVAKELNMTYSSVGAAFALLHTNKKVYVFDWEWRKTVLARIYRIGDQEDADRPSSENAKKNLERKIHKMMIAQGRFPFDPQKPRCDVAASWIR